LRESDSEAGEEVQGGLVLGEAEEEEERWREGAEAEAEAFLLKEEVEEGVAYLSRKEEGEEPS
jgi:hypothetical protein